MALYQTLELQIGRLPVQEHNLNVDILAVLVEEIFQEMANTLVGYVAANNNVSVSCSCCRFLEVLVIFVILWRVTKSRNPQDSDEELCVCA